MKINRRDFIKTGGMVMLGSLAVPSFLGSCTGNKVDQATGISFAQNHFGVSESDMKKVLAAALEKGGDYADLFFEHSYRNNIGLGTFFFPVMARAKFSAMISSGLVV